MHDARSNRPGGPADGNPAERTGTEAPSKPVHVPPAQPSGDLTVLERLEAFRDLIRHGNALLGEVVAYCRDAEAAVNQLAAEKQDIDRVRGELHEARERADAEANAARCAMAQVDIQRRELTDMRDELLKARSEIEQFQALQAQNAKALEQSLLEARQQQARLEQELEKVRTQAVSSRTLDAKLGQVAQMETKLRVTERELTETRRALEDERSRRDRAIALIKPRQPAAGTPA